VPRVERRLRGVRVHLEPDEHAPSAAVQRAQDLQLHAVKLDRGVRFADEQQPRGRERSGEIVRGQRASGDRVDHRVEHDRHLAVLAGRVSDRQAVQRVAAGG
jgi:hypothetical protein